VVRANLLQRRDIRSTASAFEEYKLEIRSLYNQGMCKVKCPVGNGSVLVAMREAIIQLFKSN
jgi:hypothetical protein